MNKLMTTAIAGLLVGGMAQANQCEGFKIGVKNTTDDNLLVTRIKINDATIQPGGFQQLDKHSQEVFTINKPSDEKEMHGVMEFHTISIPSKKATIHFTLQNSTLACLHTNNSPKSDFDISELRSTGGVNYTVQNK